MSKANAAKFLPLLARVGANHGLPPEFLVALAHHESGFDPNATATDPRDLARGGSRGLLQMSWKTAVGLGFKGMPEGLYYPDINAELGAQLAVSNAKRFKLALTDVAQLAQCHNAGRPLSHITDPKVYAAVKAYSDDVVRLCGIYREPASQYAVKKP